MQAEQRAAAEAAQAQQQREADLAAKRDRVPAALSQDDPAAVQVAVRLPSGARISHRCYPGSLCASGSMAGLDCGSMRVGGR